MSYTFYPIADSTLPIPFDSFDGGTGASITITGLAVTDIEIYKGTSMIQRASDNGYTLTDTDGIDLDGTTGIQGFSLDLSDNSDAGFYAADSWYRVVVSAVTIDAQTVNFTACMFRIASATRGLAGTALPNATADAAGGLAISDAGGLDLDAKLANTNEVTAARMGALTDWIDGGRLDLLLDAIKVVTDLIDLDASGRVNLGKIFSSALSEGGAGRLAAAFVKLFDVVTPALVASDVMRGTDSAASASVCTDARLGELDAANIPADVDAILTDTADMQPKLGTADTGDLAGDVAAVKALLPAALVGGKMDSNIGAIDASTAAAVRLALSAGTMVIGVASGVPTTTTTPASNLSAGLDDDHYKGRVLYVTSAGAAKMVTQPAGITGYDAATKTLTHTALTTALASGDGFLIV